MDPSTAYGLGVLCVPAAVDSAAPRVPSLKAVVLSLSTAPGVQGGG